MNTRDWNLASPARLDRWFKSCKRGLTTPLPSSMETFALPSGFRFHPTDEELIFNYLKGKLKNGLKASEVEVIPEVDLYRCEPWDLPVHSTEIAVLERGRTCEGDLHGEASCVTGVLCYFGLLELQGINDVGCMLEGIFYSRRVQIPMPMNCINYGGDTVMEAHS
jgi:hypothetical protein